MSISNLKYIIGYNPKEEKIEKKRIKHRSRLRMQQKIKYEQRAKEMDKWDSHNMISSVNQKVINDEESSGKEPIVNENENETDNQTDYKEVDQNDQNEQIEQQQQQTEEEQEEEEEENEESNFFSFLPIGSMIVDLRNGTLTITTNQDNTTTNNSISTNLNTDIVSDTTSASLSTSTMNNHQLLLPNSRELEISLRSALRPSLFALDTIGGYNTFLYRSIPMLHRQMKRDDICINETVLYGIIQKHIIKIFTKPLSRHTLTLYKFEKNTKKDTKNEGNDDEMFKIDELASTFTFFTKIFLNNLSKNGSNRSGGGKNYNDDMNNELNTDVIFYSKLFQTRLWYQWLSEY